MSGLEVVGVIVGVIILWGWIYWYRSERLLRKYNARIHFPVGRYVVGLEDRNYVTDNVECVVAPHDFVFAKMSGTELGRIPRNAVEEVAIDDKSQITQRLTVTRMVALGVFALAAPKKRKIKEWCVGVRWLDGKGIGRVSVFEFTGSNPEGEANEAATKLMTYIPARARPAEGHPPERGLASPDSKVCPYCAESIKAAAIVCRFCNRELPKELRRSAKVTQ